MINIWPFLILDITAFLLFIAVLVLVIIFSRGSGIPPSTTQAKPSRLTSFVAPLPSDEIMKIIIRFAQQTQYDIENIDLNHGYMTLGSPATLTSWGCFYPIYLTPQADRSTLVEIGIKRKHALLGSLVSQHPHHERCIAGIRAAIFAAQT